MTELTAEKRGTPIPSASDNPGNPMEDRILAAAERIAARQIFFRTVMIMRRRWNFSYKNINPVRIAMHDYPDSAAIYDAIYERDRDLNR